MDAGTVLLIVLLAMIAVAGGVVITLVILISRGLLTLARVSKPGVDKVRRSALKIRVQSGHGPGNQLLALRIKLEESLEATVRSLDVALNSRQHTGNLPYIVQTLQKAGTVVRQQLMVAARDPDPAIQEVYARTLGAQAEQILQTAAGVRQALARTAQPMTAVDITELTRRLDVEAQMLDSWSAAYKNLGKD